MKCFCFCYSFCNALNADVEQLLEDGAQWAEEVGEAGEYFESSMRAEKLVNLYLIGQTNKQPYGMIYRHTTIKV